MRTQMDIDTESTLTLDDFFEKFFDESSSVELCKTCTNFGRLWSCPPFEKAHKYREKFQKVTVVARRVKVDGDFLATYREHRKSFDALLLEKESQTTESLAFYAGSCFDCKLKECTRKLGQPCPFADMRTSLEAIGFDVVKIARELFEMKIEWINDDNKSPQYLTLVGALFFD